MPTKETEAMGERRREAREREAIKFNCPYCCAEPRNPCVNQRNTQEPLKHPHPERMRQVPRR